MKKLKLFSGLLLILCFIFTSGCAAKQNSENKQQTNKTIDKTVNNSNTDTTVNSDPIDSKDNTNNNKAADNGPAEADSNTPSESTDENVNEISYICERYFDKCGFSENEKNELLSAVQALLTDSGIIDYNKIEYKELFKVDTSNNITTFHMEVYNDETVLALIKCTYQDGSWDIALEDTSYDTIREEYRNFYDDQIYVVDRKITEENGEVDGD